MIETFQPQCSVLVRKRINTVNGVSTRVSGSNSTVDLSPLLSEGSSIRTRKSVRDLRGTFTIAIPDEMDSGLAATMDSLYGSLEAMDYVEIRLARSPNEYTSPQPDGSTLPIHMRGFIGNVARRELVVENKPRRFLVITGSDYGLIPDIYVIYPRANYALGIDYMTQFPLEIYGMGANFMAVSDWLGRLTILLNKFLQRMASFANYTSSADGAGLLKTLSQDVTVEASVSPYPMQSWSGSLTGLMQKWSDPTWNELFIEDRDTGPFLVCRPLPFVDLQGQSIQGVTAPQVLDAGGQPFVVTDAMVIANNVERSDENVANFFLVMPGPMSMADPSLLLYSALTSQGAPQPDYANNSVSLFGLRPMEVQSFQMNPGYAGQGQPSDSPQNQAKYLDSLQAWTTERRALLTALNQDNAVLESGHMLVRGSERFKVGNYLNFSRGKLTWKAYLHTIEQEFLPFDRFVSHIYVDRGTGFVERTRQTDSPALMEGARGVYS